MKRIICIVAAIVLGPPAAPAAQTVDEVFAALDRPDGPGCAVAVTRGGTVVFEKGYGMANLEHGIPITPRTVFYAGSVSKQFVAAAVALLAEDGALGLDDDIRRYVPELPAYGRPMTVRHLLHHTSGLRDYLTLIELAGRDYLDGASPAEVLALLGRQRSLNFLPGDEHLYSNSGYFLLGLLVERASGRSLRVFADEAIFRPLGMVDSHFHDDVTMIMPRRAEAYFRRADSTWGALPMRFALVGSGGLYTTVRDLARWEANFYRNRLGRGSQGLIETLHSRGVLTSGDTLDYAFGMVHGEYRGLRTVRHGGSLGGYRAHLVRFPDHRLGIAILCNSAEVDPGQLADRVAEVYLGGEMAPRVPPAARRGPEVERRGAGAEEAPAIVASGYGGRYYSEELEVAYVIQETARGLALRIAYREPQELRVTAPDEARFAGGTLRFQRASDGRVSGFELDAGRVRGLRFVKQ